MSMKAYKYRIYANKQTTEKLAWVLDRCRELYNAGLQERRDAYEMAVRQHPNYYHEETRKQLTREHSVGYYEQKRELVDIKELRPEYQEIASHVLQDVIMRLKRAYDDFFRRVHNGEQAGYPRFHGRNRYDSFCYPDGAGWKVEAKERPAEHKGIVRVNLKLTKIGSVNLHLHRNMQGRIKTLTIKREGEHWYAIFSCEVGKPEPLPTSYEDVGIDLGVTHFAALSNGKFIDHPRYLRHAENKLAKAQQALSRKQRGSHKRKKAVQQVAKCHRKIANQRKDFQHKASHNLVNQFQIIVFEDLRVKSLTKAPAPKQDENGKYVPNGAAAKAGLNKSILDAGWSTFIQMVCVKAACCRRHDGKGAAFNMNTNRVTNEAIAYFAGLFDGEGSINIFKQPNKKDRINPCYFLEISMGNTHKGVLHWVLENFGGRLTHNAEQQTNRNHRTWRWRASSNEACAVLKILLPYLLVKKEQAQLAIEFQVHVNTYPRKGNQVLSDEELAWREARRAKLSTMRFWKEAVEDG